MKGKTALSFNAVNLPRSMNFLGDCDNTFLKYNFMQGYTEAINLEGATLPDQFEMNAGSPAPLDNIWNDPPLNPGAFTDRVTGSTNGGNLIEWYYQPGTSGFNHFDPLDNGMISPIITTQPGNSGFVACADYNDGLDRDEKYGAVVGDSLQFEEYEDENIYLAKAAAFNAMKEDTTILHQGNAKDADYQNFYNAMAASNIGLFAEVNELAGDTNLIAQAAALNENINDTNSIEYYSKTVNDLYLNKTARGMPLNASDTLVLENIAHLTWQIAGDAKYTAIAMLGLEVHSAYVPMRKAKHEPKTKTNINKSVASYSIYPNPVNSSFYLQGNLENLKKIELLSADGKLIKQFLSPFKKEFSIADIANGFYQVKLTEDADRIFFLKLSIIR
jgi:hypothetical protein